MMEYTEDGYEMLPCYACQGGGCPVCNGYGWVHGNKVKTLLWLDDVRDPYDKDIDWMVFSPIGRDCRVVWVESYEKFVQWIKENGLPDGVALDHDLGKVSTEERNRRNLSKKQARRLKKEVKTGYDCAKWLLNFCMDNKKPLPLFSSQSANPVGRENILKLLTNYKTKIEDYGL